ncbi:MAG: class I SAM-dependent rRNA methyltransferase [Bacteroidales bacterium]|jgi:23S rRNA (cytosine1962-C5)-methyltransferase|nr:class I SAM-dependent rRNA methyltransferase [Bacteroidales bacterium]
MVKIFLKRSREESLERFHPWIFSGAIQRIEGSPAEGELVAVYSFDRKLLGTGHYQSGSIAVRILEFGTDKLSDRFWFEKLLAAYNFRNKLGLVESSITNAYRLVHGEGDMLPGLVIDIYNDTAVLQAHSAGIYLARNQISDALLELYGGRLRAVYDKSSGTVPSREIFNPVDAYLFGEKTTPAAISENGKVFNVDWCNGQKTGFFLDQRDNRALIERYAKSRNVLNLFCYTGGFSIYALTAGATSVSSVDSSRSAIELLEKNVELNRQSGIISKEASHKSFCTDAVEFMKREGKGIFDLIVVDPPAFAKHKSALSNALRAYQRLNAAAIEKVAHGGIIFTFSCSQVVDKISFAQTIFSAAAQTGRAVRILHRLAQAPDHPVNIYHPEGEYLKGLVLFVE